MQVEYTPQFIRRAKKLPPDIQLVLMQRVAVFESDWQHPSLKTHKLKGKMAGYWSFSVDYDLRVIFKKAQNRLIFMTVGSHDQVY